MPNYSFEAQSPDGAKLSGGRESASSGALASSLRAEGLVPLSIVEQELHAGSGASPAGQKSEATTRTKGKVRPKEVIFFSHQMRTLMKSGIPIVKAIQGLSESQSNPAMQGDTQGPDGATRIRAGSSDMPGPLSWDFF